MAAQQRKLFTTKRTLLAAVLGLVFASLSLMSPGVPKQDHSLHGVDLSQVPDGRYEAAYRIVPPLGTFVANRRIVVVVEVKDHRMANIEVLKPDGMEGTFTDLAARVLTEQSTTIDGVTGATWSKLAYLKAAERALSLGSKEAAGGTAGKPES